jgi:hypothetical protein
MGYCYDLVSHLAGQPLQIMIKHSPPDQPPSYLFNFQVSRGPTSPCPCACGSACAA